MAPGQTGVLRWERGAGGLPANAGFDAHAARIAGDERRDAEGAAHVARVDQVLLVEDIFRDRGDFPAALRRAPAGAEIRGAVAILPQAVTERRIVILEVVLCLVRV